MTMRHKDKLNGGPERRALPASDFEIRADGGDNLILTGYASVFESPYDVYGGPPHGWTEIVDRRAFDKTLASKPDVHLLINHEGMSLARTKSGTLSLSTDSKGLKVRAVLDRRDPDVQRLEPKMQRGDMDEMSFAFRTIRQEWNEDDTERRLIEVSIDKGDVSVVNHGANPATSSQLNSLSQVLDRLADFPIDDALAELRSGDYSLDVLVAAQRTVATILDKARPRTKRRLTLAELRDLGDSTDLRG